MSTQEVHISGLVVYTKPQHLISVRRSIEQFGDCEVAAEHASGKLVLVIEASESRRITETIERIQGLDGVINTVMAYHHCEDETALNEELPHDTNPS